jgi:hypothetical protein
MSNSTILDRVGSLLREDQKMLEPQLFGDFLESLPDTREYLVLGFSPGSISIKRRWRNNGLSADFLADYMTTFFPSGDYDMSDDEGWKRRIGEFRSAVSYIANELLENAMKYHDERGSMPIDMRMQLHANHVVLQVTNSVNQSRALEFQRFIEELLAAADVSELYLQQLEKSSMSEDNSASGLGLLTMVQDYGAKLAWRFQPVASSIAEEVLVTTMVYIAV